MSQNGQLPDEERACWVAFQQVPYVGAMRQRHLLEQFGSLQAAWHASGRELALALDGRSRDSLIAVRKSVDPQRELERVEKCGARAVTIQDGEYPKLLAEIPAPPPLLYVKGDLIEADDKAVAIIGTRKMTAYGREVTTRIAADLASAAVTIVSGMARGIDGVAHTSALQAGGRTIAVLGSGIDVIYPPEHRNMAVQIAESGALVTEFPLGAKPDAPNFPARNRIISGLSLGAVVVEAPARSGTLITVDFALDQGREVFVVPGSVLSAPSEGANRLLRDGARVVRSAADILDDLQLSDAVTIDQAIPVEDLSDGERRLMALIRKEPQHVDDLLVAANLSAAEGAASLTMLELKGLIRNTGGQHFVTTR